MSYITCKFTSGRLGNYLFMIISSWAYAKKNNINFVLDNSFKNSKYYSSFFNKIDITNISNIKFTNVSFDVYENCQLCVYNGNNLSIDGYLQNANNFDLYRNDVLQHFFSIDRLLEPNNNFFIHIRLTDFQQSSLHNINLEKYYENAINHAKTLIDFKNVNIYIVSDDIESAKTKQYLSLLPHNNLIYIDNRVYDEIKTFDIFKNCYLGCIIGNSTYAWWGAYVINNPNKLVIIPDKYINSNHDFSGLYLNYTVINV